MVALFLQPWLIYFTSHNTLLPQNSNTTRLCKILIYITLISYQRKEE